MIPQSSIAHYRILSKLGEGGMGEVWRATDTKLNRDVAVKVLPAAFAQDPDRLRRFLQEAQAAGSLNHPNILTVYDVGESGGTAYLVTELLEGETLRQRLSGSPLPVRKAIEYAAQAALGLAAAHAKKIVHRDIKPENLFVTREGPVKILDFGLAKVSSPAAEGTSAPTALLETTPGMVLGTVGYMAPEQVRGVVAGHRCDIFSLGAVLYEMLTGRRAFAGESLADTMSAILKEDPAALPASVPAVLGVIVRRCLEKNPEERFESARDLAFALQSIPAESAMTAMAAAAASPRRGFWRVGAAALVAAALAGTWILAKRTGRVDLPQFRQVTFRRGLISGARFANEGKTIVYSAAWDGKPAELFSTQEGSPESRPLGIKNAHVAAISRAGEMALILSTQPGFWPIPTVGTLARVPVSGGAPREIAERVVYADWSPDGNQLAVVRQLAGGQVLEYPVGNQLYQTSGYIGMPKISPAGDLIVFIDSPNMDWFGEIVVVDTKGKRRVAAQTNGSVFGFAWSPDGTQIRFCGTDAGVNTSIKTLDLTGRVRVTLPMPGLFVLMDGATDGRVMLMHDSFVAGMYFRSSGATAETDLYWHDNSVVRDISPDGSQILFSEGAATILTDWVTYMRGTDGSPAVRLGDGLAMAFSPDGKWAMLNPAGPRASLMAFPTRAGKAETLAAGEIRHFSGRWLNDGKRIVFVGSESGHLLRYYVQDSPAGAPRPISAENIVFDRLADPVVISPDGKSVAATIADAGVQLLPIDGGAPQSIPGAAGFAPVAWCRDGGILMYRPEGIPAQVVRVDPKTGAQRPWKELVPADRTALGMLAPIRFASDCETYAYTAQYDPSTLFVVNGAH